MQKLISKASALIEALPYLQQFRGASFVVKYGGSFMDSPDPALRDSVAGDVVFLETAGIDPVLVHGGGKAITAAMENSGLTANFIQGMRVSDEATVRVVERVLSQEINPRIVNTIHRLGGKARGFSGTEIFTGRKLWIYGPDGSRLDLGFVGEVVAVHVEPLRQCLAEGITPVISPTARGEDGQIYNCNADVVAAETAIALQARRLVFMSDVPGLLRDPNDPTTLMDCLLSGEVDGLKRSGVIDRGMIPKVDSALAALRAGVGKVSFVDGRVAHAMLLEMFTSEGVGTEIVL